MPEVLRPDSGTDPRTVVVRPLDRPGDVGWVVLAHAEIYAAERNWDGSFEAEVARIMADWAGGHDPLREAAWIAEVDGHRAGCVLCVQGDDDETAKLRTLLVDPSARGLGLGTRLVDNCVEFARNAGYRQITLWTVNVLESAHRIYQAAGFELVRSEPAHQFGHDLINQTWTRKLQSPEFLPPAEGSPHS